MELLLNDMHIFQVNVAGQLGTLFIHINTIPIRPKKMKANEADHEVI